jgi:signal transduction histidine kinase
MLSPRMMLVRSPRGLIFLIIATTVVPLATLLWLGWRLLEQDRLLEQQQINQAVQRSADLVVSALQRALAASEQRLAAGELHWPEGAVAVVFDGAGVSASPARRIAYLPVVQPLPEAEESRFAQADALEFRVRDHRAAIAALRPFASSRDSATHAATLLRLARNFTRLDRDDDAIAAYMELAEIDDAAIGGVPAGLAGRYALCSLLEQRQRVADLQIQARLLVEELQSARWPLPAPTYALYVADAKRWAGVSRMDEPEEMLAEAVGVLWERWQATRSRPSTQSGRESVEIDGQPIAVLWLSSNGVFRALVATSAFVQSHWMSAIDPVVREQRVAVTLQATNGKPVVATRIEGDAVSASRTAADAELPWRVTVASLDPGGDSNAFAARRRLLIAGFLLLVSMTLLASFLIARAVIHEHAVARLQSDFVAAVSHEFRTPLTSLRQFTDMLREQTALDADRRRIAYDALSRATERLTRLVESLLDFGRMEAGARRYTMESADCTHVVQRVVDDFRGEARPRGYDVVFEAREPMPISVDSEALSRAVWNLLDNAMKYSPTQSPIDVGLERQNGNVRVMVRDRGIGIPAHEQVAIFAKFQRGEQARTRGVKGTGIGLSMVDEIVKAHRGRIEVESEPDKGSTFTIVLPAAD